MTRILFLTQVLKCFFVKHEAVSVSLFEIL